MLKERGNLITEGIPLSRDLLDFAKANNYKISLKTGDYGVDMVESKNRLYPYDNSLVDQVYHLFISGNLYPPDYYHIFMLSNSNMVIHILRKFFDMSGKGVMDFYRDRTLSSREDTVMKDYGVRNVSQLESVKLSKEETCLINWKVRNPSQNPELQEKKKVTCRLKFKHDYANSAQSVKDMKAQNWFNRKGCYSIFTSPEFRRGSREKLISRNGVDHNFRKHILEEYPEPDYEFIRERANKLYVLEKIYRENPNEDNRNNLLSFILMQYDSSYRYQILKKNGFDTQRTPSMDEQLLANILDDMGVDYLTNQYPKFICGRELDFILPAYNLAIEVNGDYYHSKDFWDYYGCEGYDDYHVNKFMKCKGNIKLVMFTGDELKNHRDLVINVIGAHINSDAIKIPDTDRIRFGFEDITPEYNLYELHPSGYTHLYPTNII